MSSSQILATELEVKQELGTTYMCCNKCLIIFTVIRSPAEEEDNNNDSRADTGQNNCNERNTNRSVDSADAVLPVAAKLMRLIRLLA